MKIVSVATVKGGVGKTILSVHLAAGLARLGCRTLLLDLDPQGHATSLTGIQVDLNSPCVGDALLRDSRISLADIAVRQVRPNLDVAPATFQMTSHERQLYSWALRLKTVLRALEPLKASTDVVVIDCPPYVGGFMEAALHASDLTIAPLPALAGTLKGLEELHNTWSEMRDGRSGKLVSVVNMWDNRTSVTNACLLQELEALGTPVLRTRIPRAEVVNQAALSHELVYDRAPRHAMVDVFDSLASEVWDLIAYGVEQESDVRDLDNTSLLEQSDQPDSWGWFEEATVSWNISPEAYLAWDGFSVVE
jgi:chromosome partitioning protein